MNGAFSVVPSFSEHVSALSYLLSFNPFFPLLFSSFQFLLLPSNLLTFSSNILNLLTPNLTFTFFPLHCQSLLSTCSITLHFLLTHLLLSLSLTVLLLPSAGQGHFSKSVFECMCVCAHTRGGQVGEKRIFNVYSNFRFSPFNNWRILSRIKLAFLLSAHHCVPSLFHLFFFF